MRLSGTAAPGQLQSAPSGFYLQRDPAALLWEQAAAEAWALRRPLCLLCPRCCELGERKSLGLLWLHCLLRAARSVCSASFELLPVQGLRCLVWVQPGWGQAGLLR